MSGKNGDAAIALSDVTPQGGAEATATNIVQSENIFTGGDHRGFHNNASVSSVVMNEFPDVQLEDTSTYNLDDTSAEGGSGGGGGGGKLPFIDCEWERALDEEPGGGPGSGGSSITDCGWDQMIDHKPKLGADEAPIIDCGWDRMLEEPQQQ